MHRYFETNGSDKRSGVDFSVKMVFGSGLTGGIYMKSKEISMPVKEAIIRLKKQRKSIRDVSNIIGEVTSTVWYII